MVRTRRAGRPARGAAQVRPAAGQGWSRPQSRSRQGQELAAAGGGTERRRRQEGAREPAEVRLVVGVMIAALVSGPALAQTPDTFTCGSFKAESRRDGQATQWTIARGAEKMTEKGMLRGA